MLLTIGIYVGLVAVLLTRAGHHPMGLLGFHHAFVAEDQSRVPGKFISDQYGYDGMFYFFISLKPWLRDSTALGFRFDVQSYRQQRILYPVLVYLCATGDPGRSAWAMIVINIIAAGLLVYLSVLLFWRWRQPLWLALMPAFYPGMAVSVTRCLTEPLCLVWILGGILTWPRRPLLAGVLLSLAVLTRETSLLVAVGFGLLWLSDIIVGSARHRLIFIWALPLCTYLGWQAILSQWIVLETIEAVNRAVLNWPFVGLSQALAKLLTSITPMSLFFVLFVLLLLGWQILVACVARVDREPLFVVWLIYGALLLMAGVSVWDNSPSFLRVASEWSILGLLLVVYNRYRNWAPVGFCWGAAWLLTAASEWYRLGLIAAAR